VISPQALRFVEIEAIQERLSTPGIQDATVEEFYRFGTLLFSEIQQRGSEIDRKLTNVLGWSMATLAFLLLNQSRFAQIGSYVRAAAITAAILSFVCVIVAAFAVKTRMWRAPSEADWFQEKLWGDPATMKRYHILSMLATHQAQARNVKVKANCLGIIEILLAMTGLALFSAFLNPFLFS
jgi:uncharacterized membrane protein YgdD (TMEM256/DUF423 family)